MNNIDFMRMFEKKWENYGDSIALEFHNKRVSYKQLKEKIYHKSKKIPNAEHLIITKSKGIDYIITILACFKKGITFTPLVPETPQKRLDIIASQFDGECITIGDSEHYESFNNIQKNNELSYIIYTSGSTGEPKGVKNLYKGVDNIINEQISFFDINENTRFMWLLSQSFDASFSDILTTLKAGGTLVIPEDSLQNLIQSKQFEKNFNKKQITHSDIPPSVLKLLKPQNFETLSHVIVGGDICTKDALKPFHDKAINVFVVYGPTETTICSSMVKFHEDFLDKSIGKPVKNTDFIIVDSNNKEVEKGQKGELLIAGIGVCGGYVDNKLDKERFIELNGKTFFKTKDLVIEKTSQFQFVGRADRQFKHLGQLICPEEIEKQLIQHSDITNASVHYVQNKIIAFIENEDFLTKNEIKKFLQKSLPQYMIPSIFDFKNNLSKNDSNKINHKKLATDYIEEKIIEAFQKNLGVNNIEKTKNFDEQGGDSLSFMEMILDLEESGLDVDIGKISENPNVEAICKHIKSLDNKTKTPQELINWLPSQHYLNELKENSNTALSNKDNVVFLLTGGNGFLGIHLIEQLQEREHVKEIICLLRGTSITDCQNKLKDSAASQKINLDWNKLHVICGDITKYDLALEKDTYKWLTEKVDDIIHCAAQVNNILPFESLFESNTLTSFQLMKMVNKGKKKRFHNMSTLSIFVSTHKPQECIKEYTSLLTDSPSLYTGYAQSKWLSEYFIQQSSQLNHNCYNFRIGLLLPSIKNPLFNKNNFAYDVLKQLKNSKEAHIRTKNLAFDITPVDLAADVICDIILSNTKKKIHHITSDQAISVYDIINRLNGDFTNDKHQDINKDKLHKYLYELHGKWPEFNIFEKTKVKSFNPEYPIKINKLDYLDEYLHNI